jgi:U3 small nucleolar RNA-associated protein 19
VQFFQLADIFLSSSMVPAYTAAAFAKKFARLALRAPPAGAMLALGFIHNIIRRHPACMVLLHNPRTAAAGGGDADGQEGGGTAGVDVYDEGQPDPAQSRAVESSCWELAALRNHYCPQVGDAQADGQRS